MEGTNTTNTQNENSNNYLLSPEEEKNLWLSQWDVQ